MVPAEAAFAMGLVAGWAALFPRLSWRPGARPAQIVLMWLLWAAALALVSWRLELPPLAVGGGVALGAAAHALFLQGLAGRRTV